MIAGAAMIATVVIPDQPGRQRRLVRAASAVTVLLGLVFVFVRAPHPFGWQGIDHYDVLGMALARGEGFPTTDVPWGYAYFLAAFYRMFGARPWIPLVAQVLLNGLVPPLLYRLVRPEFGGRTATLSALLVSVLSFNTIYASTLASDSICTVVFLGSVVVFADALRSGAARLFAASGLLAGIASQFRPNLILFPIVFGAVAIAAYPPARRQLAALTVFVVAAAAVALPWTVRNYRLTGELIPTSTHGGIQLWYGTLQTGRHVDSRAHNPRSLFEPAPFDYTSLAGRPLIVSADKPCDAAAAVELIVRTDRDPRPQRAARSADPDATTLAFVVPAQPDRTVVYYYFATLRPHGGAVFTPHGGADDPFVFFVDRRHLEDLDRHGDLVDAFDLARPLLDPRADDHAVDRDVRDLLDAAGQHATVSRRASAVVAQFGDGSTLTVPRVWSGKITDVSVSPGIAGRLVYARRRTRSLDAPQAGAAEACRTLDHVRVNDVFYLNEPHSMRRYTALAWDNIRREPYAFAAASAYRAVRMFVVQGTSDASTAWQFSGSGVVYPLATLASLTYLVAAVAGVVVAVRRRARVWLLLTPVLYIPATIAFVLTNMRYTITVQPFLVAFVSVALTAAARAADPAGTPAASRPS